MAHRLIPSSPSTLARRLGTGDSAAENEFAETFWPRVFFMVNARCHDRELARDVSQETILVSLQAIRAGKLQDPEKLSAFVWSTARHVLSNYLRRNSIRREEPITDDLATSIHFDPLEVEQRQNAVHHAMASLTSVERAVLQLTLLEGLKPLEIARRLALSSEVVRQHKSRALRKVFKKVQVLMCNGRDKAALSAHLEHPEISTPGERR